MPKKLCKKTLRSYLILSLLVISAFGSVYSTLQRRSSVPSRELWQEAVLQIKENLQVGDMVTWYPKWAGEARLVLHDLPILLLPHQGAIDLGSAKRLWVLGAFGYDGQRLASGKHLKPQQRLSIISQETISSDDSGPINLSLLKVHGPLIAQSLYQDLHDPLKVTVTRKALSLSSTLTKFQKCDLWALEGWHCTPKKTRSRQRVRDCLKKPQEQLLRKRSRRRDIYTLDRRRWLPYVDCKLHPTEHVSKDWRVIEETPRQCIAIQPHRNKEVTIQWLPQQDPFPSELWLKYGWSDLAVRHPFRSSKAKEINLSLEIGSTTLFAQRISPIQGWQETQFSLFQQDMEGPPSPIRFSFSAPKGVEDALFCFTLDMRRLSDKN